MQSFDVLDRQQDLYHHYVLEASAGTGKTFAIENVVVRFLIGQEKMDPVPLEKILVVTFTRAATNDLKMRIRSNIERVLVGCRKIFAGEPPSEDLPDYLQELFSRGDRAVLTAKRNLEQALFCFNQAQIFTIHSFCWRMLRKHVLEGNLSLDSTGDEGVSTTKLLGVVRDFMRTELRPEVYSAEQLKIILQRYKNDDERLQKELLNYSSRSAEIVPKSNFKEQVEQFRSIMQGWRFSSDKILEDFCLQAKAYNGLCDRQGELKNDILEKARNFAALFDQLDWNGNDLDVLIRDGLFIVEALDVSQLSKKGKPPARNLLNYPDFVLTVKRELGSLVQEARSYSSIFIGLVHRCQRHLKRFLNEEEMLRYDDLLLAMLEGLKNHHFAEKTRTCFEAAIIDEFQDTDPNQWEIFRTLFFDKQAPWKGFFYIVGDPKQSIYAFRQADIYTYLSAVKVLGPDAQATLDTNYRSQPSLVGALNVLFSSAPGLIPLPRLSEILPYRQVKAGLSQEKVFSDGGASIQFFMSKKKIKNAKNFPITHFEEAFFPFIGKEILRLQSQDGIAFNQCAILVNDRYQAARLMSYLKECNLPANTQRSANLADSPALASMKELIKGMLFFRNESFLKITLGGKIIGWTLEEILSLKNEKKYEAVLSKFYLFRQQLMKDRGFIHFYENLMRSCWLEDGLSVQERLLSQQDGLEFYLELQQIAELLSEHQNQKHGGPEDLLAFLDVFGQLAVDEDERIKLHGDIGRDAVQILTLHSSKGLEFDIVFALGLANRPKAPDLLIPLDGKNSFASVADQTDEAYQRHCEEVDAEKSRQLYVAMTRAKYRLYLPVAILGDQKPLEKATPSPMELFLARLNEEETDWEGLYQRISENDGVKLQRFIEAMNGQASLSLIQLPEKNLESIYYHHQSSHQLFSPNEVMVPGSVQFIHSFTSLSQEEEGQKSSFSKNAPHDFNKELKNPHTLPSGSSTGTLLHLILETIPFSQVRRAKNPCELLTLVRPLLSDTEFASWEEAICSILFNSLKTTLSAHSPFCLADVDDRKMYREMNFIYSFQNEVYLEEIVDGPGYLKGVIDLIFEHQEKYYIVDWKSNWLGHDHDSYQTPDLEAAMHEHRYYLQAALYVKALEKYLTVVDSRPFQDIFGGVYYLFLRGVGAERGILHIPENTE